MLSAVLKGGGRSEVIEVSRPAPGPGEVRLKVEGCGVCASSLPLWQGRDWFRYPAEAGSPGHEGWGRVDELGAGVSGFEPGERVAFLSYRAFSEYDLAAESSLIGLPENLDGKPIPGEAIGCAINIFNRAAIKRGEMVAIVGIGFLGALLTQLATSAGATVIAISRREFALSVAKRCGATYAIPFSIGAAAQVLHYTGGKGCDCAIEAAGLQASLDLSSELVRESGRLVIAGYHQDGLRQINLQHWNWRGFDILNAHQRDPEVNRAATKTGIDNVSQGRIDPSWLLTHKFELKNLDQAFKILANRPAGFMKAFVTL
jgi:threonine dehydrogenase-like Zn-dependent dehydrogenase